MSVSEDDGSRSATYEIASAIRHLATAVQRLNDDTIQCSSVRCNGANSQIGHNQHPDAEAVDRKRNRRSLLAWSLLIGGERVHAVIEFCRVILDKIF